MVAIATVGGKPPPILSQACGTRPISERDSRDCLRRGVGDWESEPDAVGPPLTPGSLYICESNDGVRSVWLDRTIGDRGAAGAEVVSPLYNLYNLEVRHGRFFG